MRNTILCKIKTIKSVNITRLSFKKEILLFNRTCQEHIIIEINKVFRKSIYAVKIQLDCM